MIVFKPRGPQKATFKPSGINHFALIRFFEDCRKKLDERGEAESAFYMEMLSEYFKNDYEEGKPLVFNSRVLGL